MKILRHNLLTVLMAILLLGEQGAGHCSHQKNCEQRVVDLE